MLHEALPKVWSKSKVPTIKIELAQKQNVGH